MEIAAVMLHCWRMDDFMHVRVKVDDFDRFPPLSKLFRRVASFLGIAFRVHVAIAD